MLSKEYDVDGRNPWELEPYYSRHVIAMTREDLHGKSDIACELAFRDKRIADTEAELLSLREQLAELKALQPVEWADMPFSFADLDSMANSYVHGWERKSESVSMKGPLFAAAKPEEVNNFADIKCYSCSRLITIHQHAEADGFCPYCDAEIDLDGKEAGISNEFLTAAKPAEDK
ncbi:hypothetical protein [Yersinia proxima]|uniref:hypothetical protein n=1 Tax=Yersinia proxima TaxID=2890316 RepID=UPI003D68FEA5